MYQTMINNTWILITIEGCLNVGPKTRWHGDGGHATSGGHLTVRFEEKEKKVWPDASYLSKLTVHANIRCNFLQFSG